MNLFRELPKHQDLTIYDEKSRDRIKRAILHETMKSVFYNVVSMFVSIFVIVTIVAIAVYGSKTIWNMIKYLFSLISFNS